MNEKQQQCTECTSMKTNIPYNKICTTKNTKTETHSPKHANQRALFLKIIYREIFVVRYISYKPDAVLLQKFSVLFQMTLNKIQFKQLTDKCPTYMETASHGK